MNKKKLFLWSLYNFGTSILWANFLLYFTRWIVVDGGLSDLRFNLILAFSTLVVLVASPKLAAKTDQSGGLVKRLFLSVIGACLFWGLAALFPIFSWNAYAAAFVFLAGLVFYRLSFAFYNPLLNDLSDEKHRCRASGWGMCANTVGMIFGMVAFAPFAKTGIGALLPSVAATVILALPMMLFYRENKKTEWVGDQAVDKIDWKKLKRLFAVPGVAAALLSFYFLNEANRTMQANLSIYTKQVFDASENMAIMLLTVVLTMCAFGALIGGFLGDKVGLRRILIVSISSWVVLFPLVAVAGTFAAALALMTAMGFFLGALRSVSRAYASVVIPKKDIAYGFSFYTIFERISLFGPLVWGSAATLGGSPRLAFGSMAIFALLGLLSMFIKSDKSKDRLAGRSYCP
ncbi:MAG: MFS transporter [Alphaproteobacteria bacterium]|nr:MFS transporter [Alphaproteobacteria bacterium]